MAKTYKVHFYLVDPKENHSAEGIRNMLNNWDDCILQQFHVDESQTYEWTGKNPQAEENCDLADVEDRFKHDPGNGNVVIGAYYRHFKGDLVKVLAVSEGTEYGEKCVVYQHVDTQKVWHRPLSMFCSLVDREKYPDAKQEHRFEIAK